MGDFLRSFQVNRRVLSRPHIEAGLKDEGNSKEPKEEHEIQVGCEVLLSLYSENTLSSLTDEIIPSISSLRI